MPFDVSSNYFELFELPTEFSVDTDALEQRYRTLQQVVHPDRYATASDLEKRLSMQQATRLNEACQVLKNPLLRARYLLELKGIHWEDEQSAIVDPTFLMEQMELREGLSEVRGKSDPMLEIGAILDDVVSRVRVMTGQLGKQFQDGMDEAQLQQTKEMICKLQFLNKLKEEAESLEADLEDEI